MDEQLLDGGQQAAVDPNCIGDVVLKLAMVTAVQYGGEIPEGLLEAVDVDGAAVRRLHEELRESLDDAVMVDLVMRELGHEVSAVTVAEHYGDLLDGFVLDPIDETRAADIGLPCQVTDTLMRNATDKVRVAREVLAFAAQLRAKI